MKKKKIRRLRFEILESMRVEGSELCYEVGELLMNDLKIAQSKRVAVKPTSSSAYEKTKALVHN